MNNIILACGILFMTLLTISYTSSPIGVIYDMRFLLDIIIFFIMSIPFLWAVNRICWNC